MIDINQNICKGCGICGDVCLRHIPVTIESNNEKITIYPKPKSYAKYALGLGKEIWQGVDAAEYVKKERQTWQS